MKYILVLLLLCNSINAFAKSTVVTEIITAVQISKMFVDEVKIAGLFDKVDKEEKVSKCTEEYIKKQSRSYSKIAQDNLYNLIHNFDDILSKIYGKKVVPENISHQEKIELLAKVQCEAYYKMGILK